MLYLSKYCYTLCCYGCEFLCACSYCDVGEGKNRGD